MNRIKILHVVWSLNIGGLERAVFQLLRAFKNTEFEAHLLVCKGKGIYAKKMQDEGVNVFFLKQNRGYNPFVLLRFIKIIKHFNGIHFHSVNPLLMMLAAIFGKRLFFTQRGGEKDYSLKKTFLYVIAGWLIKRWFFISGNTNHAAQFARKIYKLEKEVITTYNGIDFSLLEPKRSINDILLDFGLPKKDKIIIGSCSKLIGWKRQDILIKALNRLDRNRFICFIFGDGPKKKELNDLIKMLNLSKNVFLAGNKVNIGDYLQLLDIFVLPSNQSESFGNAVVEAMSFGLPCIVMKDSPALLEHIDGENGLVAENEHHLSKLLHTLIEDKNMRVKIGDKAREITKKYTYENSINSYRRLYLQAHF